MLKAVLFDLDDTLLANDMAVFLPPYLQGLSSYAQPLVDAKRFVPALHQGIQAMMRSPDAQRTNREVFWECFCHLTELEQARAEPFLAGYYSEQFARLATLTQPVSGATELVDACFERGLKLVLATNPIFPQTAIEQRLQWSGIELSRFALVTSYEHMRSAKPAPRYFREIVETIGCSPAEALMVGNDPEQDIAPAQAAGLHAVWVTNGSRALPKPWPVSASPGGNEPWEPRALTDVWPVIDSLTRVG